jgi:uncharacterized protein (DUF305 family)
MTEKREVPRARETNDREERERMGDGKKAPAQLIVDGEYSEERFIDMMAAHHTAAISMAKVARQHGERQEIKQLAEKEISDQQAQVEELSSIKERAFGSPEVATEMNPEDPSMLAMLMPDQLAAQSPFDKAFIDSTIPHHARAIEMAGVALMQSEDPEIQRLARRAWTTRPVRRGG